MLIRLDSAFNPVLADIKALEGMLSHHGLATEFSLPDFESAESQRLSAVVATPRVTIQNGVRHHEIIILEPSEPSQAIDDLAAQLSLNLESHMITPRRMRWGKHLDFSQGEIICLMELAKPLLDVVRKEDFATIQEIVSNPSKLLWVAPLSIPAGALAAGMARSVRNEVAGKQFRTLSVEKHTTETNERLARLVTQLAITPTADSEFREEDGVLKICRVVEDEVFDEWVSQTLIEGKERIESIALEEAVGAQKLAIHNIGMLDSICLEPDDHATSMLADDEVEVEVKASGLK